MHLRKLVRALPLMLAAMTAAAQSSGSFQEGARAATMTHQETEAPVNRAAHSPRETHRDSRAPVKATANGAVVPLSAASPYALAPAGATPLAAVATATGVTAIDASEDAEASSTFDFRNLLTLVGALALVGWLQRRRPD